MSEMDVELRIVIHTGQELLSRINASMEPNQATRFGSREVAGWFNSAKETLDRLAPSAGAMLHKIEAPGIRSQEDIRAHRAIVVKMIATLQATLESQAALESSNPPLASHRRTTYDVFVSFSSRDLEEAKTLAGQIEAAGGRTFLSAKDIPAGEDFANRIREALTASHEVWILVTPNSLKSEWVISEWGAAWALQKPLVPILLGCVAEQLPERLRKLQGVKFHLASELAAQRFRKVP